MIYYLSLFIFLKNIIVQNVTQHLLDFIILVDA